jgi:hypothetical protein
MPGTPLSRFGLFNIVNSSSSTAESFTQSKGDQTNYAFLAAFLVSASTLICAIGFCIIYLSKRHDRRRQQEGAREAILLQEYRHSAHKKP